jgi:hypothetical protein
MNQRREVRGYCTTRTVQPSFTSIHRVPLPV